MFRNLTIGLVLGLVLAGAAAAETYDVKMLTKGEGGAMVFEPAGLRLAPGDSIHFVAATKGHNAETIEGMLPEGATPFAGKINEEVTVTFDQPGFYGIRCKPHYAMGMVFLAVVGDAASPPESFLEGRIPNKAKERLESALAGL